jgi:hypothetical protein
MSARRDVDAVRAHIGILDLLSGVRDHLAANMLDPFKRALVCRSDSPAGKVIPYYEVVHRRHLSPPLVLTKYTQRGPLVFHRARRCRRGGERREQCKNSAISPKGALIQLKRSL